MRGIAMAVGWGVVAGCAGTQAPAPASQPDEPPVVEAPEPAEMLDRAWWTAGQDACPNGTVLRGQAPPMGDEIWCERDDGVRHGPWTWFYPSGDRLSEGRYRDGVPDGLWTTWHDNGNVKLQGMYQDGKEHGRWSAWHETGQPATDIFMTGGKRHGSWSWWHEDGTFAGRGMFVDGVPHGRWERWDEQGRLRKVEYYDRDVLLRAIVYRDGEPVAVRSE